MLDRECYGITEPDLITFFNIYEKLPRLTEEEERWHGALVGNTPYGILHRVLRSFYFDHHRLQQISSSFKKGADVIMMSPEKPLPYSIPLAMPDVISFPKDGDIDAALNSDNNFRAENRTLYYFNKMRTGSIEVQEVVAKYLAFLVSYSEYYSPQFKSQLTSIYEETKKIFSIIYPNFTLLENIMGIPICDNFNEYFVKRNFVYMVAKVAFLTCELSKLYQMEINTLREAYLSGNFWDCLNPNKRFEILLKNISQLTYFENDIKNSISLPTFNQQKELERIYNLFTEKCAEILETKNSFTDPPFQKSTEKALLLSYTLANTFYSIKDHFGKYRFGYTCDPTGKCTKVSYIGGSKLFNYYGETSFHVCIFNRVIKKDITIIDHKMLLKNLKEIIHTGIFIYILPISNDSFYALFYPVLFRGDGYGIFQPHYTLRNRLIAEFTSSNNFYDFLGHFRPDELCFGFPSEIFIDNINYRQSLTKNMIQFGSIVFIDIYSELWKLNYSDWFCYISASPDETCKSFWNKDAQSRLGLLQYFKVHEDIYYTSLACVPFYFREITNSLKSKGLLSTTDFTANKTPLIPKTQQQKAILNGHMVFSCSFIFDCLPEYNFNKIKEVNPWTFFI